MFREQNKKMHRLLERQLRKWLPGYPEIPSEMRDLFCAINESYFHHDNDRLMVENAMRESSDELTVKKGQINQLLNDQTIVINSLKEAVVRLVPETEIGVETDLLCIADILQESITRREVAESMKEQTDQRLLDIIDNLNLGMVEYDVEGRLTDVQNNFASMFGYDVAELEGKTANFFQAGEKRPAEKACLEGFHFSIFKEVYEAPLRKKNGETFWLFCTTTPVYDLNGQLTGGVMVVFDITSQKKLESQLRHARRDAEAALEVRKTILANVSHELRTPVNAIVGITSLLSGTTLNDIQKEYIQTMKFSSDGLLVLIDDLLDISRIESGKVELEKISFSPSQILHVLSRSLGLKAEGKGLKFNYHIDEGVSEYLFGDPHRLNQVLTNLISNAIKFTHEGEIIVKIELRKNESEVQRLYIGVKDTGIGIANDRLGAVFQEFSQEDSSTTRKYGGTGLGLTISRKIVELMGGSLNVVSEKNVGSEFYFEVDFRKSEAPAIQKENFNPDLTGVRMLVVEDNPVNQFLATSLLKTWNAVVEVCANGVQAIDMLSNVNFDVILMDLQMPLKDGFETTVELREKYHLTTPIIALTANAISGERDQCLQLGMNEYMSKPFQPEVLYRKIQELIHKDQSEMRA